MLVDQDIESVSYELQKNGVSLPAFQKIGRLFAKELTSDFERLHTDIINLNKAIDEKVKCKCLSLFTETVLSIKKLI